MERLVELRKYDIKDSNIELLGSELERRVREHGGDKELAWEEAGKELGVQIWRIEKFHVVTWPEERKGTFYEGDSYIVLHTYKKSPESDTLAYDLHFWLGKDTTQDEAGTAAYKTVELDDHLHGRPVQYREVQGYESNRFLSYFPKLIILQGGVSTGFRQVVDPPAPNVKRLYQITASTHYSPGTTPNTTTSTSTTVKTNISIREVPPEVQSLNRGDVFVLDLGDKVIQYNTRESSGKERYLAADFVRRIADGRPGRCQPAVKDELSSGAGVLLSLLNAESLPQPPRQSISTRTNAMSNTNSNNNSRPFPIIFRISDSSGTIEFSRVSIPSCAPSSAPSSSQPNVGTSTSSYPPTLSLSILPSDDAYLIDTSSHTSLSTSANANSNSNSYSNSYSNPNPSVYIWIGKNASIVEKRLSLQIAQNYLYNKQKQRRERRERRELEDQEEREEREREQEREQPEEQGQKVEEENDNDETNSTATATATATATHTHTHIQSRTSESDDYSHSGDDCSDSDPAIPIIRVKEGSETREFLEIFDRV